MIGTPRVVLYPDPTTPVYGNPVNSNPGMDTNLAGWIAGINSTAWVWGAPGLAVSQLPHASSAGLFRDAAAPIARDPAATAYRVRARTTVDGPMWIIPGMYFGTTPLAAQTGPFWSGANAVDRGTWVWAPAAGTYTVEAVIDPKTVGAGFGYVGPYVNYFGPSGSTAWPVSVDYLELAKQALQNVDITCLLDQVEIRHGRSSPTDQPEASTITMDISADTEFDVIPDALEVGAGVGIFLATPLGEWQRFYGRITDIAYGWDDARENTPDSLVGQVNAAGVLSDLGRRVVGDTPWPLELDGARINRIFTAAGITMDPNRTDPGTVQILARDVDSQAALPLSQAVADDALGVVWESRDGVALYADAEHRRNASPGLTLDACDILVSPTWTRSTDGLLNLVSIGYGVTPEGSEQPRYVASSATSQSRFGRYEISRGTQLADLTAAQTLGNMLLARNVFPVWVFSDLPVDVAELSAEDTGTLLGLDVHSLIVVTGLPKAGSAPTEAFLWVEGWTETLAYGAHGLTLVVSDYCRTAPAPRWDDVTPELTWDNANGMWDQWVCIGPNLPRAGRWMDVPATLRWNQIPNSVTWDTWNSWANPATLESEVA